MASTKNSHQVTKAALYYTCSSEPPDFSLEELVINIQEKEQLPLRTLTCTWQKRASKGKS